MFHCNNIYCGVYKLTTQCDHDSPLCLRLPTLLIEILLSGSTSTSISSPLLDYQLHPGWQLSSPSKSDRDRINLQLRSNIRYSSPRSLANCDRRDKIRNNCANYLHAPHSIDDVSSWNHLNTSLSMNRHTSSCSLEFLSIFATIFIYFPRSIVELWIVGRSFFSIDHMCISWKLNYHRRQPTCQWSPCHPLHAIVRTRQH